MKSSAFSRARKSNATRIVDANCDVRTLIAEHLGVDVERVTDDVRLSDLGADWLDRLELLIVIETQFADASITDTEVDRIDVVGDLVRYVESLGKDRQRGAGGGLLLQ
jgi:acyl carrier protein